MPPVLPLRSDAAICAACVREFSDPADRRYRYPFIQCAACGPDYALGAAPSASPPDCPACRVEFETPASRRHRFARISCPDCGPRLRFSNGTDQGEGEDALGRAVELLHRGGILVVKATGGFHLAVDAQNEEAVSRLRVRKKRPHKPFAVMARDLAWVEHAAFVSAADRAFLERPERPILLLPCREDVVAPSVAPGLSDIGLFLPSSGLQLLLLQEGPPLQVMTSANLTRAPTARDDAEALAMLSELADAVLLFDRPIRNHGDDSVFRSSGRGPIPIRRARGFVPRTIPLPFESPPLLAVGAQEKNTVCLAAGREAHLSPHIGDLSGEAAWQRFLEDIAWLEALTGIVPLAVAHDLHPDYRSTRYALERGLPRVPVQHHHAHVAAICAEHGRTTPVLAAVFDGTGLGDDGQLWGGEFFLAGFEGYRRLGALRPLPLPGGAAAIENPWRIALAARIDAGASADVPPPGRERAFSALRDRLLRGDAFPASSGAGRWFDAVAALLDVRHAASYDGQAPAELESLAEVPADPLPFEIRPGSPFQVDLRPTIRALLAEHAAGVRAGAIAGRFHETMACAVAAGCELARRQTGVSTVVLGGGCFQNRIFLERATEHLEIRGFEVLAAREVPPNDGGIALGQAAIAAHVLAREGRR